MAKAIKQALIAALIAFVTFTILGPAGFGLSLGVSAGTAAIVSGVTTLVASGVAMLTSKGIEANAANLGTKITARNATAGRQIIYGQTRVGGTIVHMQTSGTDNNKLHIVAMIAGHEIEDLLSVRINDVNCIVGTNTTTQTVGGQTVYKVNKSQFKNTDNDNKLDSGGTLMRFSYNKGDQTTADGFLRNQLSSSIPSTHVFNDCAYIYMQCIYDSEKLPQPPQLSFEVKGKKCYDPRNGSTAWTQNPALIIRDFLTDSTYGMRASSSEINDTSAGGGFASAANTCDQDVTSDTNGSTEDRYTTSGFSNMTAAPDGILEGLLSSCAGKISYTNGKFNLFVGATQTPSLVITDDKLLSSPSISTNPNNGDLYNSVKAMYVDRSNNYVGTDAPVFADSTFLAEDTPTGESSANYVKQLEVQLPYTTTQTMADRLGKIALRHGRQAISMNVLTTLEFMKLQPCDWVYVTNERMGYTNKVFEVVSTNLELITEDDVPVMATALVLSEVNASVYNHAANEYGTVPDEGSIVIAGERTTTAPSNLTLSQILVKEGGVAKINILASWANTASSYIRITEVSYKTSGDTEFSSVIVGAGTSKATIANVAVGETYNFKIRHQSIYDVYSSYTSVSNITIQAATEAPNAPTGISASTGKELNILVTFTNSSSADLRAVKIYRKTTNVTPTNDTDGLVHTMSGVNGQVSTWLDGKVNGLTAGTTYYYWAKAINTSDVASSLVGSASGNFIDIDIPVIGNQSITNAQLAVDAIQANVIAAGAITATAIGANAVTTAKLANDSVTAAVIAAGAIGTSELGVDAVTTAKIADNAITASQIGADAVTTAKIANDAVTSAVIAAGAITATELGANAVTTAKIANNAVTSAVIAAGAITATELGADAVTAAKIADNAVTADAIGADAVETAAIADNAITNALIATDAVNADSIVANAITATEIAAGAITASEIAANAITAAKIAAGTITASEIAAGAITATEIAADAITATKIAADAVTADAIAANTITASEIAANSITASQIAADAITANEIAANAVTADAISAGTITATELAANSVTANEIAANAVTASEIAAGTITASEIAANAITSAKISAGAVTASEIAADTITASNIAADAITANEIAANAVTANAISANTITSAEIAANAITASEIAAGAVTTSELAANTITAGDIAAGAITTTTLAANAITAAKIAANTITASEIAAGAITATEITAGAVTAVKLSAGAVTADKIGANAVTAGKISVTTLSAVSSNMGTITAGAITAGSVSATTLNLNGATLSADANGLTLNIFDAFTHINTDTMGNIGGTAGNDVSMTSYAEVSEANFVGSDPRHIAAAYHSNGPIQAGSVMGVTPLFSHTFTTKAFSGTRPFVINVALDPVGSYSSASSTGFAFAMRATTSASAYTATAASSYVTTRGTSIGGSRSSSPYNLNDIVNLSGSTQYYVWVFGVMDDVNISSTGARGIINGQIAISGLNK